MVRTMQALCLLVVMCVSGLTTPSLAQSTDCKIDLTGAIDLLIQAQKDASSQSALQKISEANKQLSDLQARCNPTSSADLPQTYTPTDKSFTLNYFAGWTVDDTQPEFTKGIKGLDARQLVLVSGPDLLTSLKTPGAKLQQGDTYITIYVGTGKGIAGISGLFRPDRTYTEWSPMALIKLIGDQQGLNTLLDVKNTKIAGREAATAKILPKSITNVLYALAVQESPDQFIFMVGTSVPEEAVLDQMQTIAATFKSGTP
jgi:hypothetical protein